MQEFISLLSIFGFIAVGFMAFSVYFIFKQLEFVLRAISLYKEMIARQDMIIKLLSDIRGGREDVAGEAKDDSVPSKGRDSGSAKPPEEEADGRLSDEEVMRKYSITVDGDQYRFQEYKYDKLKDAVEYARREAGAD